METQAAKCIKNTGIKNVESETNLIKKVKMQLEINKPKDRMARN